MVASDDRSDYKRLIREYWFIGYAETGRPWDGASPREYETERLAQEAIDTLALRRAVPLLNKVYGR